eukprot:m51a1_g700 hypothetical protein (830) ;mRNA; f:371407-374630
MTAAPLPLSLRLLPRGPPFGRYLFALPVAPPLPPSSPRRFRPPAESWTRLLATATASSVRKDSPSPAPPPPRSPVPHLVAPAEAAPGGVCAASALTYADGGRRYAENDFDLGDDDDGGGSGDEAEPPARAGSPTHNELFQDAVNKMLALGPDSSGKERMEVYKRLTGVTEDFLQQAVNYARVIISEMRLPDDLKTIKPRRTGGVAGGLKYVVRNIRFKIPKPDCELYSTYDQQMKVAGHDLHGCSTIAASLLQVPGLAQKYRFPLVAVIDYLGWRVFAQAELPLYGRKTLIYGSDDGGKTARRDDSVHDDLARVAARLGIAEHAVGDITLATPFDLEVHQVRGMRYMVDFSRLFPPTAENIGSVPKGQAFAQLMRPEFIGGYAKARKPLNPDGFSFHCNAYSPELVEATRVLREERTAEFAQLLAGQDPFDTAFDLVAQLHRAGINIRYLGFVLDHLSRAPCQTPAVAEWRLQVMVEIAARVISKVVGSELRQMDAQHESQVKPRVIEMLNVFLGDKVSEQAETDWWGHVDAYCRSYWPHPDPTEPIRPSLFWLNRSKRRCALFRKISHSLGLMWFSDAWELFSKHEEALACREPLTDSSLRMIEPIVKRMNVCWHSRACYLSELYQRKLQNDAPESECLRVLGDAEATFALAIGGDPANESTLRSYAACLCHHATHCERNADHRGASKYLKRARETIDTAMALAHGDPSASLLYIAAVVEDRDGKSDKAMELYQAAVDKEPQHTNCMQMHADMLAEQVRMGHPRSSDLERIAERRYIECVNRHPDPVKPCNNYAIFLLERGRVQESGEMFLNALGYVLNRDGLDKMRA